MSASQAPRGLLTLSTLDRERLDALTARSCDYYRGRLDAQRPLDGKVLGVLFLKTSTRTRTAFTVATVRLGGVPVQYGPDDLQLNTGESVADTARVFGGMLDGLVARTAGPLAELEEFARAGAIPVVNAMATEEHPTQGVCDLATLRLEFGEVRGLTVLYLGEGNNSAAALAHGLALMPGCDAVFATPPGYGLDPRTLDSAAKTAAASGGSVREVHDLDQLPDHVDVVYTTRWQTTGTRKADASWKEVFRPFYVDEALLARWPAAKFMHDLPAHRGEEVSGVVLDGPRSLAWSQARMKLYSAMAVLEWVFGDL